MKLRWLSDVLREYPDFAPRCRRGEGDLLLSNDPYNEIYHVVVCRNDGEPLYDLPARSEPRGAIALPLDEDGNIGLIRLWRATPPARSSTDAYPFRNPEEHGVVSLEVPRGFPDDGEASVSAARREAEEELGLCVQQVRPLGWCNLNTTFFLTDLPLFAVQINRSAPSPLQGGDGHEEIHGLEWFSLEEVRRLIGAGEIRCAVTLAALSFAFSMEDSLKAFVARPVAPHPVDDILGNTRKFLEDLIAQLWEKGVSVEGMPLDHFCYRADSEEEYKALNRSMESFGSLLVEGMIAGRPIATWSLHEPVRGEGFEVSCVELVAPKKGKKHQNGLEHAEFVVPGKLSEWASQYAHLPMGLSRVLHQHLPEATLKLKGCAVKFHSVSLPDVIAREIAAGEVVPVPETYWD